LCCTQYIHSGLLNVAAAGSLSERSLNHDVKTAYGEAPLTDEKRLENIEMVLGAARMSLSLSEGTADAVTPHVILEGR
jgi:hypothetical protein